MRIAKLGWLLIISLGLLMGCQLPSDQEVSDPIVLVQVPEGINESSDSPAVSSEPSESPISQILQSGVKQVVVVSSKDAICGPEEKPDSCRTNEEWLLDPAAKRLERRLCSCGVEQKSEVKLSAKDLKGLEQALRNLVTTTAPVPCVDTAAQVRLEILGLDGETLVFPVNYGQCGTQNQLTPRVEAKGFEVLMQQMQSLRF